DVSGDGRTALKFSANRYIQSTVGLTSLINPIKLASDTRPWDGSVDANGVPTNLGASTGFNIGTTNVIDPNLKVPYTNELSAELQQQFGNLVVSASYNYRARRNVIGFTNLAVPTSDYTPVTVTEKNSGQTVTVYNQLAATKGQFNNFYSNYSQLNDSFKGVELMAQKRMANHWMVMASATFEKTSGDINTSNSSGQNTADLNNPNFQYRIGPQALDVPFFFKADGAYEAPYGFRFGATSQYYRGAPTLTTVSVDSTTIKLTQGTQSIAVAAYGTTRLPSVYTTDFNVTKVLHFGNTHIEPRMSIFNLFNKGAITSEF